MKLINGECLEEMDKLIKQGIKVDAIITDPPYWTTACKWDSVIPFKEMWERLNKLIKLNWAIVLFGSEPFSSALRMSNIKNYKYDWIWDKDRPSGSMLAKKRPLKYHEIVSVFNCKWYSYNPQKTKWKMMKKASWWKSDNYWEIPIVRYENNLYYPRSIQTFKACHNMTWKVHPTQKPVPLMEYLIKTYTNEWETVLDFTMWSWTTGVACKNLNRDFIWIEMDRDYFNICKKRIW